MSELELELTQTQMAQKPMLRFSRYMYRVDSIQVKKSGVGVDFELLVRCLLLENKDAARKPSMIIR